MHPNLDGGEEEEGRGSGHDYPDAAGCPYCCKEDLASQTPARNQNMFGCSANKATHAWQTRLGWVGGVVCVSISGNLADRG